MAEGDRRVRPSQRGGWEVLFDEDQKAASHHQTDAQARAWARATIRHQEGSGTIRIQDRHGHVREERVEG
jgi:hypothetical protein